MQERKKQLIGYESDCKRIQQDKKGVGWILKYVKEKLKEIENLPTNKNKRNTAIRKET